jgi:hypothetical protein
MFRPLQVGRSPVGNWIQVSCHRHAAEDATPESAAFGDQAPTLPPRGATAGRTARRPATPAHGGCHDRNPPHEAPVARAMGTTWQSHAIGPRTGAPRAAARGGRGGGSFRGPQQSPVA